MKQFCRKFWPECDCKCEQCQEALAEAVAVLDIPPVTRTEEEKAALDCHGQP